MEYANYYSGIICPHCKNKIRMEAHDMPWNDEEVQNKTCWECEQDFQIKAHTNVSWTTHKDEDDCE